MTSRLPALPQRHRLARRRPLAASLGPLALAAMVAVQPARAQPANVQGTPAGTPPSAHSAVQTAPQPGAVADSGDAVLQLLQHKGLLPDASESALVRQVRDKASDMVLSAMQFLGVPYRRGGDSSAEGFDCSGFTRHVFERSIGLVLPRRADEQASLDALHAVRREELRPGDLVFFNTMRRAFSHVGIYVGEGKFIHAPRTGGQVRIEDMRQAYWTQRFNGARRAPMPQAGSEEAGAR